MKVIVCTDEKNGMLFNKRRQSQDRALRADVCKMTARQRLWMNAYSGKQFQEEIAERKEDSMGEILIAEDFLEKAGEIDFCFVENESLMPWDTKICELIVYRWNRNYPADFHLDLDLEQWKLIRSQEFEGHSHEKITREHYVR